MVALAGWVATLRRANTALRASNNATPVQTNVVVMSSLPRKFGSELCRDLPEAGKTGVLRETARSLSMRQRSMNGRESRSDARTHSSVWTGGVVLATGADGLTLGAAPPLASFREVATRAFFST